MPWCPNCKLEYVEGIKICPDCKSMLVESLEDADSHKDYSDAYGDLPFDDVKPTVIEDTDIEKINEEKLRMMEIHQRLTENPSYKSKKDRYVENRSGAGVLIVCGIIGGIVLLLNALGIINIPFFGFSLILVNVVMGCLFLVFLFSGIRSLVKMKELKPLVATEEKQIEDIVNFIREQKKAGCYSIDKEDYEASYLEVSEKVVNDVNSAFTDLEPGFAFYVVDRFAGDILDED